MTKLKQKITIARSYKASIDDVWDLWTTAPGIESWWGPEGFITKVRKLELRPGGIVKYAMTATGVSEMAFMKHAGMPLTTEAQFTFSEVTPKRRLAYRNMVDFIPGVESYSVNTVVEFATSASGVKMTLTLDAMHDKTWTQRSVMGWKSQLGKLAKLLEARREPAARRRVIPMQKITPFLWFDDRAEEAARFYTSIFKNSKITEIAHYGEAGPGQPGSVMSVSFQLDGQDLVGLNGGPAMKFTPAISFFVNCTSQKEVDDFWAKLSRGGKTLQCGWVTDKFGVSWQIVPSILHALLQDKNPSKSKSVMKAMLKMVKLDIKKLEQAHARG